MKPIGTHNYYVYILTNRHKEVLYIGVTNDLIRRHYEHQNGEGSTYTKKYKCHYLVYYERFQFVDMAIAREKELKGWSRKKKDLLISAQNPDWRFLDPEVG
ncbi:MAG: GIY-YIG nuclease family protein [Bacteroidetes bacterium]|nr:GIY-YIG nuclease family protein [Bacteroidota bacterium]